MQNIAIQKLAPTNFRISALSMRLAEDTAFGNNAHISSIEQTWSDSPLSIAGVTRSASRLGVSAWLPSSQNLTIWQIPVEIILTHYRTRCVLGAPGSGVPD
jgi:hypothetical protein